MDMRELKKTLKTLVTLEESDAPVVSWYAAGPPFDTARFAAQRSAIMAGLPAGLAGPAGEAMDRAARWLEEELPGAPAGVAVFARAGSRPFFMPLAFQAPLPDWLSVGPAPNIYHLVELKDTYHRFVVAIVQFTGVRIVEVTLGAVTQELWMQRPELRARVDRTWTRDHYRRHREALTDAFLAEQAKVVDRLMAAGGHTHLVLAGEAEILARLRGMLPNHLLAKLMDTVEAYRQAHLDDIVAEVLEAFVRKEEQESQAMVEVLSAEVLRGGLAVVGTEPVREALLGGEVDVLVVHRDFDMAAKEDLARLAERTGALVEVVNESVTLERLGGVGAVLRFLRMNGRA